MFLKSFVVFYLAILANLIAFGICAAQEPSPAPPKVESVTADDGPPSDAIVLLDGTDLSAFRGAEQWRASEDHVIVSGRNPFIETKQSFGDCQLHLEFAVPAKISGKGQHRGNSGVYFMGLYEVQILDSRNNKTYSNGQCAALYAQTPPKVNVCREPGQWQSYDIAFKAPRFDESGELVSPAYATVFHNGVLVQSHVAFKGPTDIRPVSKYTSHPAKLPLRIQNHRCPVQFRNIWIRRLDDPSEESRSTSETSSTTDNHNWTSLLDVELSKWDKFLGVPHPSVEGLPEDTPRSENFKIGTPMGINNDPLGVFSASIDQGEPVVRITGEIYGALTSKEDYSNYHIKLDFKWGKKKYIPRMELGRDSGLLYHSNGPFGAYASTWMDCLECQIMERDYGDLFCLGNTSAVVATNTPSGKQRPIFQPGEKQTRLKIARRLKDHGNPVGWNTAEVFTIGNRAIHVINGKAVMALTDARVGVDGKGDKLESGKIQIQSEGAELFIRRVKIRTLEEFPKSILKQLNLDENLAPRSENS